MMRSVRLASLLTLIATSTAAAQGQPPQGPPPGQQPMGMGTPPAAQMLLSNVGQLELTDAQVVRLAAIARRSEARRRSMSAAMDSARVRFAQPGDSVARQQFRQRMESEMRRTEEQMRTDQRDAIAVLTPDQQAKAWNMVANRGVGGGRGMRGGRGQGGARGMAGQGMGAPGRGMGRAGQRPGRGAQPRRPMEQPPMREQIQRRTPGDEFAPPMRRPGVRRPDAQGTGSGE